MELVIVEMGTDMMPPYRDASGCVQLTKFLLMVNAFVKEITSDKAASVKHVQLPLSLISSLSHVKVTLFVETIKNWLMETVSVDMDWTESMVFVYNAAQTPTLIHLLKPVDATKVLT